MGLNKRQITMTKKLVWRLGKLPTPDEVRELVKEKILTQDEARGILFSIETEEDRDKSSLESEIKFLRDLVEKLSHNRNQTVEIIRTVEKPYYSKPWYKPYEVWCQAVGNSTNLSVVNGTNTLTALNAAHTSVSSSSNNIGKESIDFSSIKTF